MFMVFSDQKGEHLSLELCPPCSNRRPRGCKWQTSL